MNWDTFFTTGAMTFIDIMTWVIISLLIFEIINFLAKDGLYTWIKKSKKSQVLNASLLGLIPGCGGPLLLVPLYNKGNISLAALTASFIATFGDAAFVILSQDPEIFLHLMWIGFVTAVVFGYTLQLTGIGKKIEDKLIKKESKLVNKEFQTVHDKERNLMPSWFNFIDDKIGPAFVFGAGLFLFPSTIMNLVPSWEANIWLEVSDWIAFVSTMLVILFYSIKAIMNRLYIPNYASHIHIGSHESEVIENQSIAQSKTDRETFSKLMHDAFLNLVRILVWVFVGLYLFELAFFYFGDALETFFGLGGGSLAILIAICVGMIPGCGPQIALANFFLQSGTMNLPAFAGNSINQDGDAAFAVMATDLRTSLVMRLLNVVPALTVGFTLMGLENIGLSLIS